MKKLIFLFTILMTIFLLSSCQTYRYSVSSEKQISYIERQIGITEKKIALEKRNLPKGKKTSTLMEMYKGNLVNYQEALQEAIKASGTPQVSVKSNNSYGSARFVEAVASGVNPSALPDDKVIFSKCNLLIQNRFLKKSRQLDEKNTIGFEVVSVEVVGINKSKLVESGNWGLSNINSNRSHEIASGILRPEENLVVKLPAGTYVVYFYRSGKTLYKTITLDPGKKIFVSDEDLNGTNLTSSQEVNAIAWLRRK